MPTNHSTDLSNLAQLAQSINERQQEIARRGKSMLELAKAQGHDLIAVKASLAHGQWLPWVAENLSVDIDQAQKYMRLANGEQTLFTIEANTDPGQHLTLNQADKLLRTPNIDDLSEKEIVDRYNEIRSERTAERRKEQTRKIEEIAAGNADLDLSQRYPVIYADPPWKYEHSASSSRDIENHYPTMDLQAICDLQIADLAAPDAILFLWTTSPKLEEAMQVIAAWGFRYKTCAVWDKQKIGMGYYFRQNHELLLVATRGSIPTPEPENRPGSIFTYPRGKHSAKPPDFYQVIEAMYPELSKIELFCRSPRQGWAAWGNQV